MVQNVLNLSTQGNENPDVRDRAYIYWRLLSSSPQSAKTVVLAEKPPIKVDSLAVNPLLLNELIHNLSNLASVYFKPASQVGQATFKGKLDTRAREMDDLDSEAVPTQLVVQEAAKALGGSVGDLLDLGFDAPALPTPVQNSTPVNASPLEDLLGDLGPSSATQTSFTPKGTVFPTLSASASPCILPKTTYLYSKDCAGLEVEGTVYKKSGDVILDMTFSNQSQVAMEDFAIQFNVNA